MAGNPIRPATEAEREWAARLMARSEPWITLGRGYEACLQKCTDGAYQLFIAGSAEGPRGFLLLHPCGVAGAPYIASIAVEERCRGRGIGSALLRHVEELYCRQARFIFLCVSSFNTGARALYERSGYKLVGELEDYVIDGASEHLMSKRLRSQ